jgi:hypothetical protein
MALAGAQLTLLEEARRKSVGNDMTSMWTWSSLNMDDYSNKHLVSERERAKHDRVIVIECWKFEESGCASEMYDEQVRYIDDDDLIDWLEQPRPTRNGQQPSAGLKFVHKYGGDGKTPFSLEAIAAMYKSFGIPLVELHLSSEYIGACGKFMSEDSNAGAFQFEDNISYLSKSSASIHLQATIQRQYDWDLTETRFQRRSHCRIYPIWIWVLYSSGSTCDSSTIPTQCPLATHPRFNERDDVSIVSMFL